MVKGLAEAGTDPADGAKSQQVGIELAEAATSDAVSVATRLRSNPRGLTSEEASRRLRVVGPNAVRSHGARPLEVLVRQVKSPLLLLLVAAATVSLAVGQPADALIILVIVSLSVGLGFFNEYRSEKAVEALHAQIRHTRLPFATAAQRRLT
jgi:P-type Mg2+ transporter